MHEFCFFAFFLLALRIFSHSFRFGFLEISLHILSRLAKMARRSSTTLFLDDEMATLTLGNCPYLGSPLRRSPELDDTSTIMPIPMASMSSTFEDDDSLNSTIREEYQPRTLGSHNIARISILPIYPFFVLSPTTTTNMIVPTETSSRTPHLLLANVPSKLLFLSNLISYRSFSFRLKFKC